MPKFNVRFSALTDLVARVDVEAETPELAVIAARKLIDDGDSDAVFELCDNGLDPIIGTTEAMTVDDAEGEEVLSLPFTPTSKFVAAFKPEPQLVTLSVQGGVVQNVEVPEGVAVKIYDYDIEGTDAAELDEDESGDDCIISHWGHAP